MPRQHRPVAPTAGPRFLPMLALVFLCGWLTRDLAVDAGLLAAGLPAHDRAPTETFEAAYKQLAPSLPPGASVDLLAGPGVGDAAYWWATYVLYPHHVRVNPGAADPPADFVVVVRADRTVPEVPGYLMVERVDGPHALVVAYRRPGA